MQYSFPIAPSPNRTFFLRALRLLAVIGTLLIWPLAASLAAPQYTPSEQVGFAFYKLGGAQPDFNLWVEAMDGYATIREQDRAQYRTIQRSRLEQGFANFIKDQSLLHIHADIVIGFPDISPDQISLLDGKRPFSIRLAEVNDYIPYYIGGQWIVVVLENMNQFHEILLREREAENIRTRLNIPNNQTLRLNARFVLKPTQADMTRPVSLPKAEAWLLGARIMNLEIWSRDNGEYIWGYQDDQFMHSEQRELLDLYHR